MQRSHMINIGDKLRHHNCFDIIGQNHCFCSYSLFWKLTRSILLNHVYLTLNNQQLIHLMYSLPAFQPITIQQIAIGLICYINVRLSVRICLSVPPSVTRVDIVQKKLNNVQK